jgi:excisionase family DNA binding protein
MTQQETMWSINQIAQVANVSRDTVERQIKQLRIKPVRIGRLVRIQDEDAQLILQKRKK